jgi:Ca2+:H+ antiporter
VFAVVMIVCNGLVDCIFIGGLRYREQDFQVSGANLYLACCSCWHHDAGAQLP